MVVFPNCKINLGLKIREKRPDGFHELETVFYPLRLKEALEVVRSEATEPFQLHSSGSIAEPLPLQNTVSKAWQLIRERFPELPPIHTYLHKAIPSGAGLGAGSADGAFMLKLLNDKFRLELKQEELLEMAARIGSDAPFFILNQACVGRGRGEVLEPTPVSLESYHILLVNPGIHISTPWAFSQINPSREGPSPAEIVAKPLSVWKDGLINDFEPIVAAHHPEIAELIWILYGLGAAYAAMSGSGSTIFGIFETAPVLPAFPHHYFVYHQQPA